MRIYGGDGYCAVLRKFSSVCPDAAMCRNKPSKKVVNVDLIFIQQVEFLLPYRVILYYYIIPIMLLKVIILRLSPTFTHALSYSLFEQLE